MARTVTCRADQLRAGSALKVWNRSATVVGIKFAVELGPIGQQGPASAPTPYYWVEIEYTWDAAPDGPVSTICLEGNHWVETRDALDNHK